MSVGRSVRAPVSIILRDDTAIDHERSDYGKYVASGFDRAHLALKQGEIPTTFTIGQLTHEQRIATEDLDSEGTRMRWAELMIRCGLRAVAGYQIERPDGSIISRDGEPERADVGRLGSLVTEKWLNEFAPTAAQMAGLAVAIRVHSEVRGPLSRPSGAGSGVSASSLVPMASPPA